MIVDRVLFDPLRHANPREGAKLVVRAHTTSDGEVEVEDEGAFGDIDTPEEYERALSVFESAARVASKDDARS